MLTQVIMLVHIMLLLIFTGSADSLTAAPIPTVMPTQTSATELMPTQTPPTDLMPTQTSPIPTVMPTQTPPTDLMPTQTSPIPTVIPTVMPTQTSPTDLMPTAGGAGVSSEKGCSYRDVLTHLDFINDTLLYKAARPVLHHRRPTQVNLNVAVEAILGVVEKEQKLISRLYIQMKWINEFISWDPSKFCGIERVSVPSEWLWKPDITIDERLEDNNALNPYVRLYSDGRVIVKNEEMVVSTCRMNVYKFPFDTQSCNLTFASGIYKAEELELKAAYSSGFTRIRSMRVMWGEYEWEFENFTYMKLNETIYKHQQIVYTITMKRKAVLYIVNFLLPVLFFLCLDMASFLMSDSSGEKLGFKITVLLAVTVLQLILNDILPATSNTMPIIAMYCMGTFSLMLLSLLETVVVTYLLAKDSVPQKTATDEDHNLKEDKAKEKRSKRGLYFYNVHGDDGERDTMHELQSVAEEDNGLKGESHGFQVILDELRDLEKNLHLFFKSTEDGGRPGYWTRIATRINKVFSIVYVTTVIVFLAVIFKGPFHPWKKFSVF